MSWILGAKVLEVGPDAVANGLRLAHVEQTPPGVQELVYAGGIGKIPQLLLKEGAFGQHAGVTGSQRF